MNRQELMANFIFEVISLDGDPGILAQALANVTQEAMGGNAEKFSKGVAKIVMHKGLALLDEEED